MGKDNVMIAPIDSQVCIFFRSGAKDVGADMYPRVVLNPRCSGASQTAVLCEASTDLGMNLTDDRLRAGNVPDSYFFPLYLRKQRIKD